MFTDKDSVADDMHWNLCRVRADVSQSVGRMG